MASQNMQIVKLSDGREVCLSYGVPVAAFIPTQGYIKTDARWSVTTSKHMNAYAGPNAKTVPDDVFVSLIHPIEAKGRR